MSTGTAGSRTEVGSTMRTILLQFVALVGVLLLSGACAQNVRPIDLHDETIPLQARKLVADAKDSIDIARAKLDEARRELRKTRSWRENLLGRKWPSGAQSAVSALERLADARVRRAELAVERAEENIEYARAKYRLITAKTSIRNDLAVYKLEPLRRRVKREKKDVDELDDKIFSQRKKIARIENSWWDEYSSFARGGGKTRALFVSSAGNLPSPDLRSPQEQEGEQGGGGSSGSKSGD